MIILETKELTKRFGSTVALSGVSVNVESGKITGLLGPNGSGKTTFIKTAAGLLSPNAGECFIDGSAPGEYTKSIVSYLPDRNYLPDWMNVRRLMDYFEDFYEDFDRTKAEKMVAELGIGGDQRIKQMSKGTKEKLQLIMSSIFSATASTSVNT